jgi:hypothetical protein
LVATGGAPILTYQVWFDQGANNWTLAGQTLQDYFIVPNLIAGQDYKFKYRAVNIFGEGAFSGESTIKAAMRPD